MKQRAKKLIYLPLVGMLLIAVACGGDQKEGDKADGKKKTEEKKGGKEEKAEKPAAPEVKLAPIALQSIPFMMEAPEGATVEESFTGYIIRSGAGFAIEYSEDASPVADIKAEAEANDINKIKKFVIDEENGFLTENEVMRKTEYHFYYVATQGDQTYQFENEKGPSYTLDQAMAMYNACKSLKFDEAAKTVSEEE